MATSDRRRRLADDAARVVGFMAAVLTDARRAQVPIPEAVAAAIPAWRDWAAALAAGQPGPDPQAGGPPLLTRPHDWPPDRP
jgi:hypothetical protein